MLKQRVLTALALMAVLIPALFSSSPIPFVVLAVIAIAAAQWEWARMHGSRSGGAIGSATILGLLVGWSLVDRLDVSSVGLSRATWWIAATLWMALLGWALRAGPEGWRGLPRGWRLGLGPVLLVSTLLAVVDARLMGLNFLMSVFCLVWIADIAAYFGGRAFGRRKLAPHISPGKSWEGAWSGFLGVVLLGLVWVALDRYFAVASLSLFSALQVRWGWGGFWFALVGLTSASVTGDLFESLIKRSVGVKDSSQLLPGHGGVLDRIDALLPVFPLAMALVAR